jgi:hypothetical protein
VLNAQKMLSTMLSGAGDSSENYEIIIRAVARSVRQYFLTGGLIVDLWWALDWASNDERSNIGSGFEWLIDRNIHRRFDHNLFLHICPELKDKIALASEHGAREGVGTRLGEAEFPETLQYWCDLLEDMAGVYGVAEALLEKLNCIHVALAMYFFDVEMRITVLLDSDFETAASRLARYGGLPLRNSGGAMARVVELYNHMFCIKALTSSIWLYLQSQFS